MPKSKRLRIFAGPNGSGKSTLFESLWNKSQTDVRFKLGHFINSDRIEKELTEKGFINLEQFGLNLNQDNLDAFLREPDAKSLLKKAKSEDRPVDISVRENVIVDNSKSTHSYEASLINSFIRKFLLDEGISYSFETVMSHPSKLNELKAALGKGYRNYLYFVCLDDPQLNVSRVENRVQKGGHYVREDKIVARYGRTLDNLIGAIKLSYRTFLFDNSGTSMTLIAEIYQNKIVLQVPNNLLPNWFIQYVINRIH